MLKQLFPFSRSVAGGEGTHPPPWPACWVWPGLRDPSKSSHLAFHPWSGLQSWAQKGHPEPFCRGSLPAESPGTYRHSSKNIPFQDGTTQLIGFSSALC